MLTIKWEDVMPIDFPVTHRWRLPIMRMENLTGETIIWRVGFNGFKLIIWKGHTTANLTSYQRDIKDKNSQVNIGDRAWNEARNLYLKKRRKGFIPPCSGEPRMIKVMRAELYDGDRLELPVDMDAKLDGLRNWFLTSYPLKAEGYTRGNTKFPHIEDISDEITEFSAYLPPNCAVDGEIWHPDYHLNEINSIVKNSKVKDKRMGEMEYHIFDLWWEDDLCWEKRRSYLERAIFLYRKEKFGYEGSLEYGTGGRPTELIGKTRLFLTKITVANSYEQIEQIKRHYIDDLKFEGAIIRKRANGANEDTQIYNMSRYLFGKGSRILKVIDYIYEEARCLGVLNCKGSQEGCARLVLKDERGNIFPCQPKGDFSLRRKWLQNPELIVGKYVTIYYKQLSVHNKPLNAVVKGIRDEIGWFPEKEIFMEDNYTIDE